MSCFRRKCFEVIGMSVGILSIVLIALFFVLLWFPFYTQEQPIKIKGEVYRPTEDVELIITRDSKIDLPAIATRELIRVEDGIEHEMSKTTWEISLDKGKKTIMVTYPLLADCDSEIRPCENYIENTYKYRGNIRYKPFGLIERTFFFETENFNIKK